MVSDTRALRVAAIAAFILGVILIGIGIYEYATRGSAASSISSGLATMVIAGLCYQISNRRVAQQKDRPR